MSYNQEPKKFKVSYQVQQAAALAARLEKQNKEQKQK